MAREDSHIRIRLPTDLKNFVQTSARQNERSVNGEIVYVLRQHQTKTASEHQA